MSMETRALGSVVYFVQLGASGPIKIGKTNDLRARLSTLQTSAAEPLNLLGLVAGDLSTERAWHVKFADSRLHGEWFEPTPELLAEIQMRSIGLAQREAPSMAGRRKETADRKTMQRLSRASERRREADLSLRAAVYAARDGGASVRVIGEAAQISTRTVQDWLKERASIESPAATELPR